MKKNSTLFLLLIIALISGIIAYFATNNIFIAVGVLLVYSLYLFLANKLLLIKYHDNVSKIHECFDFINSFIISLSVKNSLLEAFEGATINASGHFKEEINHIEQLESLEKINYLSRYFSFDIYQMFLNIVSTYLDQGTNILKMSDLLLQELTRIENSQIEYDSQSKRKMVEFVTLWFFTYVILIFVRVALSEFYSRIASSTIYLTCIVIFFAFVLISIHLALSAYTGLKFSFGRKHHE
jgi:hypothetical protein